MTTLDPKPGHRVRLADDFTDWADLGVSPSEISRLRAGEPGTVVETRPDGDVVVEFPWDTYYLPVGDLAAIPGTYLTKPVHHLGMRRHCSACHGNVFTFAEEVTDGQTIHYFCPGCARKRETGDLLIPGDKVTWPDSSGIVSGFVSATRYQVRDDLTGRNVYRDRNELDRTAQPALQP